MQDIFSVHVHKAPLCFVDLKASAFEWYFLPLRSQQMHFMPVAAIKRKQKRRHRGREEETEKELYHVYYAPASEFKCVRLRWSRASVIIIASCQLDRTLKWSCHFIYTQTTMWFTPKHTNVHTRTQMLPIANFPSEPGGVGRMTAFDQSCPKRSEQTGR